VAQASEPTVEREVVQLGRAASRRRHPRP
jgi:hypothetical protein